MSSDTNANTPMAGAIDPCAMSDSTRPAASPSTPALPPTPSPTSAPASAPAPTRIRTLAPLLRRDNVRAILGLAGADSITIRVRFADGRTDTKTIALADGGSLALLLLDDNPDQIPLGAFCDIRPA